MTVRCPAPSNLRSRSYAAEVGAERVPLNASLSVLRLSRAALVSLCAGLFGPTHGSAEATSACVDNRGLRVAIEFGSVEVGGVAVATRRDDGAPVIVLDREGLKGREGLFRRFVIAHECAHHQLGHLDAVWKSRIEKEIEAHCVAMGAFPEGEASKLLQIIMRHYGRHVAIEAAACHRAGDLMAAGRRGSAAFEGRVP